MRDIKFRGLNMKGEWVYGSLVITTHGIRNKPSTHTKTWIVESAFGNGGWFNVERKQYVKPETVGQFTGLTDQKGNEIYEGDICSVPYVDPMGGLHKDQHNYSVVVTFDRGCFLVDSSDLRAEKMPIENWIERKEGRYVSNHGCIADWGGCVLTVLGSIHQNPELLESN